jgi:predicted dehydrogenase
VNLLGTKTNLMYDLDFTHWDESHLADDWSTLKSQFYGESERQVVDLPRTDMFREQLEEFGRAARGEATVEVGAMEAVRALAVVRAVLESSARNGEAVALQEVIDNAQMAPAVS